MSSHRIMLEAFKEYPITADKLWDLLSHTDRLHSIVGVSRVNYEPYSGGPHIFYQNASVEGRAGKILSWKEYPHEWVRHRGLVVLREFSKGIIEQYKRGFELIPTERGTKIRVFAELKTPHRWLRPLLAYRGRKWIRGIHHYCDQFLALWIQRKQFVFPHSLMHDVRSKGWCKRLAEFHPTTSRYEQLLEKLKQHLMEAYDDEVVQMRPKDLALQWKEDPEKVIRLFLFATREKLLRLNWVILCPECKAAKLRLSTFSEIPLRCPCDFCQKPFQVDMNSSVDLRFSVEPSIRPVVEQNCPHVGPGQVPHIWVQHFLSPGEAWRVPAEMGEEKFRVRTLRTNQFCHLVPTVKYSVNPTSVRLVFTREGWLARTVLFRPGKQEVEFVNESHTPIVVALEKSGGDKQMLSAAEVTTYQDFLSLFPNEIPAPGRFFRNHRLCLLVFELKDSSAFYARVGDQVALGLLHQAFIPLMKVVQINHGAVVKMNGDQVVAVFYESVDALRAAFEMNNQFFSWREGQKGLEFLLFRVALHRGPAFSIFRGGKLDYFGVTVNHVFRILKRALGGAIALSESLFQDALIQATLKDYSFEHEMKEVRETVHVFSYYEILPSGGTQVIKQMSASGS